MRGRILPFIYCIIAIICNIVALRSGETAESLKIVGYASTIILVFYLIFDWKINHGFSYADVFVLVLFLFHFGQLMILTYFVSIYSHVRILALLDVKETLFGFRVMNLALSSLCFGVLLKSQNVKSKRVSINNNEIDWFKVSKKIIIATFPVKLILDLVTLVISFTASGDAAREFVNSFPNVLLFYGKISLLGFALLLVTLRYQPIKHNKLFLGIVIYILFMMVSGIRSENVGYLAVFLFLYLKTRINPIRVKQAFFYGVLGFFSLTFIVAVGQFRSYTDKGLGSFISLSEELLTEENVILGLFDTCGDTGYTAQEVLNGWLPKYGPTGGDAYYKGITAVIPNLMPFIIDLGAITEESSCPIKLQKSGVLGVGYENIGGSFFGEVFMNFGVVGGIIACFFWGLFFGWVSRNSSIAFEKNDYYKLIIYIPIMLASIYWVRSYFGGGIREAVWDILFGLFIYNRVCHKRSIRYVK